MSSRGEHPMLPLEVRNARYAVADRVIVDNVTITVASNGRTVLLGPNGAGKTTLLKLCHGLLPLGAGSIHWGGVEPREAAAFQAMVFQRPVLLRRSAAANIEHALTIRRVRRAERAARVAAALEWAGLTALAGTPAPRLSGGEQQSLCLARAWALQPQVLLLDEPTANLDPGATRRVEALIEAFADGGGKVLMTTHNIHQARRLADDVLFINHGALLEHSPAMKFFRQPTSPTATRFISGELLD